MKAGFLAIFLVGAFGMAAPSTVVSRVWTAEWIDVPGTNPQAYGVYHFRRTFDLPAQPEHLVVYVSGDNRYQLFVNGERVSWGPARGDLTHWRYETVDLGPKLHAGRNVLAAVVWNDGEYRAVAQVTNRTGFLLEAERPEDAQVNTNRNWRCVEDRAYTPQPLPADQSIGYYALAANEHVEGREYPWGWEQPNYADAAWVPAHEISHGADRWSRDAPNRWMLVASEIPLEEQRPERLEKVRETTGGVTVPDGFLQGTSAAIRVPAHTTATVLLDQGHLTTAYPEITVSGGAGAQIGLQYAETLVQSRKPIRKGNRNDVAGLQFYGPSDTYVAEGGTKRTYRPLFWRTYRYLRLTVTTGDEAIGIDDLHGTFTAYPFQRTGEFTVGDAAVDADLQKILATGWRTARLCAHETYMDCPAYEQLQYGGDARIQMMISLYMTGDARLMKNGISLLNSSRTAEGATYSRAPSYLQQYIPPFSLWWIGMVHDYWMYVDDPEFAKEMLPGVQAVLSFYANYQKTNGSLERMPWWNFVDWVQQWPNGEPLGEADKSSAAALDLQLLMAYGWAADLEKALGSAALAAEYENAAAKLRATILATDWDEARGLLADQPSHQTFSQQVNTLAVLAHVVEGPRARAVVEKMMSDTSLAQSSIYFLAYTNATLREVGLGDRYLEMLKPWREMLADGLTTWAEKNTPDTRSDCHAWGASPNFELLRTVAGIESMAPGFKRVRIAPNFGELERISARMPHPTGMIEVELRRRGERVTGEVVLPPGTSGEFEWQGKMHAMAAGRNRVAY